MNLPWPKCPGIFDDPLAPATKMKNIMKCNSSTLEIVENTMQEQKIDQQSFHKKETGLLHF